VIAEASVWQPAGAGSALLYARRHGPPFQSGHGGRGGALIAAVTCAQASAGYWAGEYRVLVHKADQQGSGTYHRDSSGACTSSADGSGSENVHIVGGSATMTVTGVDLGVPGSSSGLQLGGVPQPARAARSRAAAS
jgi:hypothetical protein